jgi:hypothetical protein
MENLKEKLGQVMKQLSFYTVMVVTFVVGILIGYFYNTVKTNYNKQEEPKFTSVRKSDIKLAIDENNNLLIIRESDGSYTVYQDSVGYTIFGLYAKNIWGQASAPSTPKIEK